MAEKRGLSSSEQYIKKSNRKLLLIGFLLLVVFFVALSLISDKSTPIQTQTLPSIAPINDSGNNAGSNDFIPFGQGDVKLKVFPEQINMGNVVIGSQVEAVIELTAENGDILYKGATFSETQQEGFSFETTCKENGSLKQNESCVIKILWNPVSLITRHNILTIEWEEDSARAAGYANRVQESNITIQAQSTDSKDCVICETVSKEDLVEELQQAYGLNGKLYTISKEREIVIDGTSYTIAENDRIVKSKEGKILAIVPPKKLPINLKNEVMGSIAKNGDVISADGTKLGRLLGDDTIVDSDLKVLGAAVPMVAAMDMNGKLIGKMIEDGTIIDANKAVIGKPLSNGSVVDLNNKVIGVLKSWGPVSDLNGNIIGAIIPNGQVMNSDNEVIGTLKPNGLVVNATNDLIGGTIPQGVAVAPGCQMAGKISLNGLVVDNYDQVIGRTLIDGSIIGNDGKDIATVISMGLVINEKAEIIGFVNSEGKAVGPKGSVIGCINPNGTVAAGKKMVGTVLPKGRVIGYGCKQIGSVLPNGQVMDDTLAYVGKVYTDHYVRNNENKIIGVVVPRASAIADGCRLLGLISYTGDLTNNSNEVIGCMSPDKTVVDRQGKQIGALAIRGTVSDPEGNLIGRVRLDGKVMDLEGKIIGCLQEDGSVVSLDGKRIIGYLNDTSALGLKSPAATILGADGKPTGWTIVGNTVYDEYGNPIGVKESDGVIVAKNGKFIGIIPPDGIIVSHEGLILGRYNSKTGYATNNAGERFARILPDLTAISGDKNEMVGALIPDRSTFMGLKAEYLGMMAVDGTLKNEEGEIIGAIRANRTVTNKDGKIIGYQIPQGNVLSGLGKLIGTVSPTGEVLSPKKTKIGKVLFNGLAISDDNKVLGGVFTRLAVAFEPENLIGYPKLTGEILDNNGSIIAQATPFGLVINEDGIIGRMLNFGTYTNAKNELIGWTSFDADLTDSNGKSSGRLLSNGLALNKSGNEIGHLVKRGVAITSSGKFFAHISIDNTAQNSKEKATLITGDYFYNSMGEFSARYLPIGIAVNNEGKFMGWMQPDGSIGTEKDSLGLVWTDNRIVNTAGEIVGTYIPLNSVAYTNDTNRNYLVNTDGNVVTAKGVTKGLVLAPETVSNNGVFVARLTDKDLYVSSNYASKTYAISNTKAETLQLGNKKPNGTVMMNAFSINHTNQVQGTTLPVGASVSNTLTPFGKESLTGSISIHGKEEAKSAGTRAIFDSANTVKGAILPISTFVGKSGLTVGNMPLSAAIKNQSDKDVAVHMPFGFALSPDNLWAGGKAPFGMAVDDDANSLGVIAADGAVIGKDNAMTARALPDGSVANIQNRSLYNTMPQKGGIVQQGLAFHYKNTIIGRTTMTGDILDAADNKVRRILHDGTILGVDMPLDGAVLPYTVAISQSGEFMGTLTSDAKITTPNGDKKGYIAVNTAVKEGTYKITGALASSYLITNDCKVVGQTAFNGKVINAKGNVVGYITPDKWAISPTGDKIGRLTRNGIVVSPEGNYLGRTLPDSTVVDPQGVHIGCSRNDGSVVDHSGNVIGSTIEGGLVLDENGNPIGRIKLDGSVVNKDGKVIGKVRADGSVVDENGKVIGRVVSRDEELLFNPDGTIKGTFSTGGVVKNPKGEVQFIVTPNGDILSPNGEKLGELTANGELPEHLRGGIVYDKDGNPIGTISGCDYYSLQEEKIGTILPNGTIVDLDGEVIYYIKPNGELTDKDGNLLATIKGLDLDLEKCGIKNLSGKDFDGLTGEGPGSSSGTRSITFGGKTYSVTSDNSIVDKNGEIIGYIENGRPYALDGRPLSTSGDSHGRVRPKILDRKLKATPEQIEQMQESLARRREGMKEGILSRGVITPNERIQAMARKKQDANWDSIGVPKIVSSYPVDMSRMILKDKAIPAVLTRSIDSRYTEAPVTAIVERHIYSETGRNIIIPAGSRLIGTFAGEQGEDKRAAKLEITWQRLIRPDGGAFTFEGKSGDAQGRGGVAAYLDEELVKKFAKPIMSSVVTSAIAYMMASNDDMYYDMYGGVITTAKAEAANDARKNFIQSMQVIFDQLVQDSANIPVVIYVPSGTRLTVFANEDLWLRSQEDDIEEATNPETSAQKPSTPSWIDHRESSKKTSQDIEDETDDEDEPVDDEKVIMTKTSSNNEKYYKPTTSHQTYDDEDEEDDDAVYKADTVKKEEMSKRKAVPVLPKSGVSDKLF